MGPIGHAASVCVISTLTNARISVQLCVIYCYTTAESIWLLDINLCKPFICSFSFFASSHFGASKHTRTHARTIYVYDTCLRTHLTKRSRENRPNEQSATENTFLLPHIYIHENRTPLFEGQSIVTVGANNTTLPRRSSYYWTLFVHFVCTDRSVCAHTHCLDRSLHIFIHFISSFATNVQCGAEIKRNMKHDPASEAII